MKNKTAWLIASGAFASGFFINDYLHRLSVMDPKREIISAEIPATDMEKQQHQSPHTLANINHSAAPAILVLSWDHIHQLTNRQDYDTAIDFLKEHLQTHADDAQAWYWLASCYQSQGKLSLAVETWFEYLAREQDANGTHNAIANLKRLLQQLEQNRTADNNNTPWLMEQINKLLDISINDNHLHLMLAQLHLDTDDDYQAQYHALMAANHPDTEQQAEKILSQLNGDVSDEPMQLSLTRYGEQFIVTVYIENNPANLLLDTGASISGVTRRYAAKYPFIIKNTKPIRLNTASGTKDSYLFTVDALRIGDAQFVQHMLAALPMDDVIEFDGLLGIDILGKFDFVIDQNNATLKLSPRNQ